MSLDWDNYQLYIPDAPGPSNELPRREARQRYNKLMAHKAERIAELRKLVAASGVELGTSDPAIQDLNDWFYANVEPDPERPGRLLPEWYSVVVDISLFLGEVMIERHPHLHWAFFTWGKKDVAYQYPVIMGFRHSDPRRHVNIDLERIVAGYGHQIIESRGSIPTYGKAHVRGVEIDLDAAAARVRAGREVETDRFWRLLVNLASQED